MLFTIESSFHTLSTHFEPVYMNMYLIGPLDGAVLHYMLRPKINGGTYVCFFCLFGFFKNLVTIKNIQKIYFWGGMSIRFENVIIL